MFQFPPLTPTVKKLCIAAASSTVLVLLLDRLFGFAGLAGLLVLSRSGVAQLGTPAAWLWQVITYAFVYRPENIVGATIGLLFLWLMGAPFELRFGARRLSKLLAVSVLAAGLAAVAVMILPGPLGGGEVSGLSSALVGLIAGFAASAPLGARVSLFGVLPMTQRTLLIAFAIFIVLSGLSSQNYLSIFSDSAAGVAAFFYMKQLLRPRTRRKPQASKRPGPRPFRVIKGGGQGHDDDLPKWLN